MISAEGIREARGRIEAAYSADLLRNAGHRLVDLLAAHLAKSQACGGAVLPWCDPAENVRAAAAMLGQSGAIAAGQDVEERFARLIETMLARGLNLHDPRYIGHQVAAPVPLAGWFDAVGSVTNQAMAIYDMGPWATAAEWAMVDVLGRQIGWAEGMFAGLATHGG
jgi:L-2,4-diaminobutyrate decarboxylase